MCLECFRERERECEVVKCACVRACQSRVSDWARQGYIYRHEAKRGRSNPAYIRSGWAYIRSWGAYIRSWGAYIRSSWAYIRFSLSISFWQFRIVRLSVYTLLLSVYTLLLSVYTLISCVYTLNDFAYFFQKTRNILISSDFIRDFLWFDAPRHPCSPSKEF